MKITIGFVLALLCLFFAAPNTARSQAPDSEMATFAFLVQTVDLMMMMSHDNFEKKVLDAEDCAKMATAAKDMAEILGKLSAKMTDATLKKEGSPYAKSASAQADAYLSYFKGDKKALELAVKHRKEGEKHLTILKQYLEPEEE